LRRRASSKTVLQVRLREASTGAPCHHRCRTQIFKKPWAPSTPMSRPEFHSRKFNDAPAVSPPTKRRRIPPRRPHPR
jgi:hypothetical protein